MAEIIHLFDTFRPRKPAVDKDTETAVAADLHIIDGLLGFLSAEKDFLERRSQPLTPADRKLIMQMDDFVRARALEL